MTAGTGSAPLNLVRLASGRVRLVCEFCGRQSGPRESGGLWDLPRGWWEAPFREDYVHEFDGSTGSLYTCPDCAKRMERGHGLAPCLTRGTKDVTP